MGKRNRNRQRMKNERKMPNESQRSFLARTAESSSTVPDLSSLHFDLPADLKLPTLHDTRKYPE